MSKQTKILITSISAVLTLAILFGSCYWIFFKTGIVPGIQVLPENENQEFAALIPSIENELTNDLGFTVSPDRQKKYITYGDDITVVLDSKNTLIGYSVGDKKIDFHTSIGSGITDMVIYDEQIIASKFYESGDMYFDAYILGSSLISVEYDDLKRPNLITVNDGYILSEYGLSGKIEQTWFCGNNSHTYAYDNNGVIVSENAVNIEDKHYTYSNGLLDGLPSSANVTVGDSSVIYFNGNTTYEYVFEHSYNSQKYLTQIKENGTPVQSFFYVNDKIVKASKTDGKDIIYLLDNELNYIGVESNGRLYYFIYDLMGNINSIVDSDGEVVASYTTFAYGMPKMASKLPIENGVVTQEYFADYGSGVLFSANKIIIPALKAKITLGRGIFALTGSDSIYEAKTTVFDERHGLSIHEDIKRMVIFEVVDNLEESKYAMSSNVEIINEFGRHVDFADVYIVNAEAAADRYKNVFCGDAVYKVVEFHDDYTKPQNLIASYAQTPGDYFVSYFEKYPIKVGSLAFEGQFVYADYLVTYSSDGEGVIIYAVTENHPLGYNSYNNIYDYQNNQYRMYMADTFSLENWDYTRLIPGLNQEIYEVIETHIEDALEVCSDTTYDSVEYLDDSFYSSYVNSVNGDTLSWFDGIDDRTMVTLTSNGELTVKALPLWESSHAPKQILKVVGGVVVATTIATVISVAIPGSGVVVFAILKTALIGATKTVPTTLFLTLVSDVASEQILGNETKRTLNDYLYDYFDTAVASFHAGFVSGAVVGTLRYRKFYKGAGDPLSSKVSASQRFQSRMDVVDDTYSNMVITDLPELATERANIVMSLEHTDFSTKGIANKLLRMSWSDVFLQTIKRVGLNHTFTAIKGAF